MPFDGNDDELRKIRVIAFEMLGLLPRYFALWLASGRRWITPASAFSAALTSSSVGHQSGRSISVTRSRMNLGGRLDVVQAARVVAQEFGLIGLGQLAFAHRLDRAPRVVAVVMVDVGGPGQMSS